MINSYILKFGRIAGSPACSIDAKPVNVFVGPNNSGKSRLLSEIAYFCSHGRVAQHFKILQGLSFDGMSPKDALEAINQITLKPNASEVVHANQIIVGTRGSRMFLSPIELANYVEHPTLNVPAFCQWFLHHQTIILNGEGRMGLVGDQPAGDLQSQPQTTFQQLFQDDKKRAEVRRMVSEAFGTYFVIDPTNLGWLRLRLSKREPATPSEERGIDQVAVDFHRAALPMSEASDGVKAFTGIVTEVVAGDPHIILIDEPEAFLHPSLASKLGREMSDAALKANKRIFVSTHSSSFVMGCIQSGAPVNIVRLTYRNEVPTARVLPGEEILELMRHPLLRSTGVLNGLFYEFVVVTESDSDRAFYQEINERLLQFMPEWGIPNCLFINAQNKQTIHTIIKPLRHLGIPAAGVVDIDVLKEGGVVWSNLMQAASVPQITSEALNATRQAVKKKFVESGREMKRDGGINILNGQEREAALSLLSQLQEYGIFVVPGGELESWLKLLDVGGHGPAWLISIFERIGEDPDHADYIKPQTDDVWKFMYFVRKWLANPNRRGIPE